MSLVRVLFLVSILFISCSNNVSKPVPKQSNNNKSSADAKQSVKVSSKSKLQGTLVLSNVIGKAKYYSVKTSWVTKKGKNISYQSSVVKNKIVDLYSGRDNNGRWLAMIIPVMYLEGNESFGVSLIFVRSGRKWKLNYAKPMNLLEDARSGYTWSDVSSHSTLVKETSNSKLTTSSGHHFNFKYKGAINILHDRWIKEIEIKGISIPSLN